MPNRETVTKNRVAKNARLEARTNRAQKELFEKAAALQGRSLTDFIIASLAEAAAHTILEHETLCLVETDGKAFVEALLSDAAPGKKLKAAARRYKQSTEA